jgi:hypothetical protein
VKHFLPAGLFTAAAFLFVGAALVIPGSSTAQAPECRLETIEYLAGRTHIMPNVVGCQGAATTMALNRSDHVTRDTTVHSTAAAGQVVAQQPPAGTRLESTTKILLSLSDGSSPQSTPNGNITTPDAPKPSSNDLADVSVRITLDSEPPFRKNQTIKFLVFVGNAGPATATRVQAFFQFDNLKLVRLSMGCDREPCNVVDLVPTATATIVLEADILNDGEFSLRATARQAQRDPNLANNTATRGGDAPSVTPVQPAAGDTNPKPGEKPGDNAPQANENSSGNDRPAAHLTITNRLLSNNPIHSGDRVEFVALIENDGPAAALDVRVSDTLNNLRLLTVNGECRELDCTIVRIASRGGVKLVLQAVVINDGAFSSTVSATSQSNSSRNNNSAVARGGAVPATHTTAIAAGIASALLIAGAASFSLRRIRWRQRIKVRAQVDETGVSSTGPLTLTAPTLRLRVHLEAGPAAPVGQVPIVREEISRD